MAGEQGQKNSAAPFPFLTVFLWNPNAKCRALNTPMRHTHISSLSHLPLTTHILLVLAVSTQKETGQLTGNTAIPQSSVVALACINISLPFPSGQQHRSALPVQPLQQLRNHRASQESTCVTGQLCGAGLSLHSCRLWGLNSGCLACSAYLLSLRSWFL